MSHIKRHSTGTFYQLNEVPKIVRVEERDFSNSFPGTAFYPSCFGKE